MNGLTRKNFSETLEDRQQKLSDLVLAKKLGLSVPETIVTMDPRKSRNFVKKHGGQVVFRDFSSRRVILKNKIHTYGVELVKTSSPQWKNISLAPTVLQQYVEKDVEYRVVIVGKQCFVCEINSQAGKASAADWRAYEFDKVSFLKGELPSSLKKALVKFAAIRGFEVCTMDLVKSSRKSNLKNISRSPKKSKADNYYFLEMNRPGSWVFVEALTGASISDSIIRRLR